MDCYISYIGLVDVGEFSLTGQGPPYALGLDRFRPRKRIGHAARGPDEGVIESALLHRCFTLHMPSPRANARQDDQCRELDQVTDAVSFGGTHCHVVAGGRSGPLLRKSLSIPANAAAKALPVHYIALLLVFDCN